MSEDDDAVEFDDLGLSKIRHPPTFKNAQVLVGETPQEIEYVEEEPRNFFNFLVVFMHQLQTQPEKFGTEPCRAEYKEFMVYYMAIMQNQPCLARIGFPFALLSFFTSDYVKHRWFLPRYDWMRRALRLYVNTMQMLNLDKLPNYPNKRHRAEALDTPFHLVLNGFRMVVETTLMQCKRFFSNMFSNPLEMETIKDLQEFKDTMPGASGQFMQRIAKIMYEEGYCLVNQAPHKFVENTFCHVVKPMLVFSDVRDYKSGRPMTICEFLYFLQPKYEELKFLLTIKMDIATRNKVIETMEKLFPHNGLIAVPEADWSHYAFTNGIIKIADAPRRARDGQWIPVLEAMPFEDMEDNYVCPQLIESEEPPPLTDYMQLPFGFLKLKDDHQMKPYQKRIGPVSEDQEYTHYTLERIEGESDLEYLNRWTQQYVGIERRGEQLLHWLSKETNFYISDLFMAREELGVDCVLFGNTLLQHITAVLRIFCIQRYSDQEIFMALCMLGRGLYPGRTCDNWQCLALFMGESRTGKGLLMELLYDMLGLTNITHIKSDQKDLFSLAAVPGKRAIIFDDLPDLKSFPPELILKIAAHEQTIVRAMQTNPYAISIQHHLYIATNNENLLRGKSYYKENGMDKKVVKAMLSRCVLFRHFIAADFSRLETNLGRIRTEESPQNFISILRCYQLAIEALNGKSIMGFLPQRCLDPTLEMSRGNSLRLFLDKYCTWKSNAVTDMEDFMVLIAEFAHQQHFDSCSPDFISALTERNYVLSHGGLGIMHMEIQEPQNGFEKEPEIILE